MRKTKVVREGLDKPPYHHPCPVVWSAYADYLQENGVPESQVASVRSRAVRLKFARPLTLVDSAMYIPRTHVSVYVILPKSIPYFENLLRVRKDRYDTDYGVFARARRRSHSGARWLLSATAASLISSTLHMGFIMPLADQPLDPDNCHYHVFHLHSSNSYDRTVMLSHITALPTDFTDFFHPDNSVRSTLVFDWYNTAISRLRKAERKAANDQLKMMSAEERTDES